MPDGREILKALEHLVHDLRTPLGVAVGYLRLLRNHQLPEEEDQQRAMAQTVDALTEMSRLCQDAASFAASSTAGSGDLRMIPAAQITAEVAEHLVAPLALAEIDDHLTGSILARPDGATARAVAVRLNRVATGGATPSTDIIVRVADAHLSFLTGAPEQRQAMLLGQRLVFDPWRTGPGLAVPLACLEVSRVSGQVFTDAGPSTAITVMLPLEMNV